MVDSEHLQIAQIALSVRRAPGGRAVDITSSLVMFIASHVSPEARERASPPAGLKFVSTMRVLGGCAQTVRRFSGITEATGSREQREQRGHGSAALPLSRRG
jgi:hypothetical protein